MMSNQIYKYIYVAGPLRSSGDYERNVRNALDYGESLRRLGFFPFIPHLLNGVWQMTYWRKYDESMQLDCAWLKKCDALLRIPGESVGADHEVAVAKEHDIPVFMFFEDLLEAAGIDTVDHIPEYAHKR